MKTSLKLTLAQTLFTILLYALGALILGVALYPSALLVHFYWAHSAHLVDGQRLLFLCFTLAGGYFIFGLTLIFTASLARVLLGLHVKEGVHSVGSPQMLKWMMASALYIAVRFTFMEFILLTPFCALFFKLMGAKIGKNVQINSSRVGDISILEIGDNSVIGGNATVICHSFEKKGLHIEKVRIGKNVIIGLNSIILPGVEIGDNAVIAAGAVVPKNTKVEPNTVYYGVKK
jgi:NDP-sugar pyrophosphorylase family protein